MVKTIEFKNELAQRIKEVGQELIDRADQMVGDNDLITDFSIRIYFHDLIDYCPTIEWTTEVATKNTIDRLRKGE